MLGILRIIGMILITLSTVSLGPAQAANPYSTETYVFSKANSRKMPNFSYHAKFEVSEGGRSVKLVLQITNRSDVPLSFSYRDDVVELTAEDESKFKLAINNGNYGQETLERGETFYSTIPLHKNSFRKLVTSGEIDSITLRLFSTGGYIRLSDPVRR